MPEAARTRMRRWKNSRVVNTGIMTHGVGPCEVAMVSDDIDISDTSNSANFSCRQNISEGCSAVGCSLMASGAMRPSRTARVFSFSDSAMLSVSFSLMAMCSLALSFDDLVGGDQQA